MFQSQAKFSVERARECMGWVEDVLGEKMQPEAAEIKDQIEFAAILKDGSVLCRCVLLNLFQNLNNFLKYF